MTQEELNYIKEAFSQIIDDIAGNPDWHEAARAIASDLGTLERELEKKVVPLPSNLEEAAEEYAFTNWEDNDYHEGASEGVPFDSIGYTEKVFKAGAKWMARQGETHEQYVIREIAEHDVGPAIVSYPDTFEIGDKVIVQIRKEY